MRPLDKPKGDVWYSSVPIGRNKLAQMVSDVCKEAGIQGHKSNHSLRATGATELFIAGVPEKIIQERTGHRSIECLRMYERTTQKQQQAVSNILSEREETSFATQMNSVEKGSKSSSIPTMTFNNCSVNIHYNVNQGSSAVQVTASTQSGSA